MVIAGGGALFLHLTNPPFEPEEMSWLFRASAFVGVTGLAAIGLGIYIFRMLRRGKVFYKQGPRDYGFLLLQLAPGAILSGLGNTLTPEFGWISLGLGTALSVLFLRRTGDPATSPVSG